MECSLQLGYFGTKYPGSSIKDTNVMPRGFSPKIGGVGGWGELPSPNGILSPIR